MPNRFRGIYGILTASYDENYQLDVKGIENQVEFCVRGGAHGIVVPVNASEFTFLNNRERNLIVKTTVEKTAGRVPVISGVTGVTRWEAADYARYAKEVGADGVIAMPPYITKADGEGIIEYYKWVADACGLPVFIQNYVEPLGTPMSADLCVEIIRQVDGVEYVKEETDMSGQMISAIETRAKDLPPGRYKGTMGGKACRYLLDEHRRHACGCMPACEVVDIQAKIWNLLEEGRQREAEDLFDRVLPLLNMEHMFGHSLYKEVLRRRGIIRTSLNRSPQEKALDALDHIELDRIMKIIEPVFSM